MAIIYRGVNVMRNWFKKKSPLKTHEDRIEEAQKKVASALDIFEQAKQNVQTANDNLDEVILEARADVERASATITSAESKKLRNTALHTKLSDLTLAEAQ